MPRDVVLHGALLEGTGTQMDKPPRRFHGGVVCGGVGTLKSAPDLRECGFSRATIRMFKEHLPGALCVRVS